MRRLPIRVKVTGVFALALVLVLLGTGAFLYLRFGADLDTALAQGLRSRADDVITLVSQADSGLSQSRRSPLTAVGESFAQILEPNGRVFDSSPHIKATTTLTPGDIAQALSRSIFVDRGPIGQIAQRSRLLATPVRAQGRRLVVVVGVSLQGRQNSLRQLGQLLLIGGVVALLSVSLAGFLAVGAVLRPIEAMRRRARAISAGEAGQRLPVSSADDEVSRLGSTLNEMLARLEEAFARERQFVSDASHELRTPLGILKTELEVALRGPRSRDELQAAIESAAEETDRVVQLAEDLLVIARADQGRLLVRRGEVDLGSVARGVIQRFTRRAAEQSRCLESTVSSDCLVEADRLRLEQALGNLIDNALRHGEGTITLCARRTPTAVELHVTDAGPGFPGRFVESAFERFTRADTARTNAGSGLGLAIVEAIADAHGGGTGASNLPGGGADVWFSLPHGDGPAAHDGLISSI